MQSGVTLADLHARFGVDASELVASLVDSGLVTTVARRRTPYRVDPHSRPRPAVGSAGRCAALLGARVTQSSLTQSAPPATTDLVVLSDFLVADPRVVRELHVAAGAAPAGAGARRHRPGRPAGHPWRDKLPGLRGSAPQRPGRGVARRRGAAARHRRQRRPGDRAGHGGAGAQPGRPGHPRRPRRHRRRPTREPPPTLDTTLEFDVNTGSIVARRWSRHPRCSC